MNREQTKILKRGADWIWSGYQSIILIYFLRYEYEYVFVFGSLAVMKIIIIVDKTGYRENRWVQISNK